MQHLPWFAQAATSPKPKKITWPRKKVERKKKDPKAPKRAMSAYMLWLSENQTKLAKPGMTFIDVSKAAGAEWAKVTDKSKWEKMAAKEKKRNEKMVAFKAAAPEGPAKKVAKAKPKLTV